jgi:acyl-CoA dehydrogenase
METLLAILALAALALGLLYNGRARLAWLAPLVLVFVTWGLLGGGAGSWVFWVLAVPLALVVLVLALPALRRAVLTRRLRPLLAPLFPRMSETERTALEAGTVWWDAELFSGAPEWRKLLDFEIRELAPREKAFLEGPCEALCGLLDDWEIQRRGDLTPEAWDAIRREGFMGLIIPESFGGLGFSAQAHSAIVTKLSTRSIAAAVTVMVPNSLGPAELLLHYGTDEQKSRWLPHLARGTEIPCFALTEPGAGSDAGAMRSTGVVCRGTYEGREVLGLRLSWDKRYITLSARATLVGLAFKLRDPERLLGGEEELGITCALVPASTPGVEIGERHDPLGVPFVNGPTRGRDVFVPLDAIIGGPKMAGQGWRMLMETLSAGRGLSLPGMACGASQLVTRAIGAYASLREQFDTPIGRFEGVAERLAAIGGMNYLMNAARRLTAGAVDSGQKPAVISAIAKCWLTEGMREVLNHGMDVVGGAGIVRGPRNVLAAGYQALPIGITVEGANILTRSMIVFGQGAIRCHPFALEEIDSLRDGDLARFDRALFGHLGAIASNSARGALLGWTGGRLARAPLDGPTAPYFRQLARLSAAYAVCSEAAMLTLGGTLKRRESLTGRLADGLAWLYLASAALKRFLDEGQPESDLPFLRWSVERALHRVEEALLGLLDNLPSRPLARVLRWTLFPAWARRRAPSDRLGGEIARALLDGGRARVAHTADAHVPSPDELGLGTLERALGLHLAAQGARQKLRDAVRAGKLQRAPEPLLAEAALAAGVIDAEERKRLRAAADAREEAIAVDSFPDWAPQRGTAAGRARGAVEAARS